MNLHRIKPIIESGDPWDIASAILRLRNQGYHYHEIQDASGLGDEDWNRVLEESESRLENSEQKR